MVEFQSHGSMRFSITIENWPKLNMEFVGKKNTLIYLLLKNHTIKNKRIHHKQNRKRLQIYLM